ncbi:Putative glycoside hydrolase superfamily [Septoria linicola]|uniref:Glycoside hydrolase superfamily n=1 Tax=Septoria linicola TaxID=215465 RepID=A0A9Q9ELS0_9PEZI|nr:Putative glycoside hydrolase superfamily [Septoria linicola]
MKAFTWISSLLALPCALAAPSKRAAWPDTPFSISGRDIISASGAKVVFAGVNWPGAADTMLPEGLQYNSIANIVGFIKSLNMNVVRLTYAIEMIDDYYTNSPNQNLQNTLTNALGATNGTKVLQQILQNNPQFTAKTTRLQVFDAVAAELAKQQIWIHLDNHVSKAQWCCGTGDGNAWFGDKYFDVTNWKRGLAFMANHAKSRPGFTSIGLRNELRQPTSASNSAAPYTWNAWIENMIPAAKTLYSSNPSPPLIFFSGQSYDTDDTYFIQRQTYNSETFTPSSYPFFKSKIVYEIHNYQSALQTARIRFNRCPNHGPVVMSEFGFDQTDGSSGGVYAQCIKSVVTGQPGGPGGWMQWTISGSYYIKEGTQDSEDTWGLLNKNWSGFRNTTVINNYVKPFIRATLK